MAYTLNVFTAQKHARQDRIFPDLSTYRGRIFCPGLDPVWKAGGDGLTFETAFQRMEGDLRQTPVSIHAPEG